MMKSTSKPQRRDDDSIKETFESVVMAFILAFVFRAYVVEAFVIPTGSMAPTLLGQHAEVRCIKCGYRFTFDVHDRNRAMSRGRRFRYEYVVREDGLDAACPMCHHENTVATGTRIRAGDRILVHKYVYSIGEPRRWDVVVFKDPQRPKMGRTPLSQDNFIKRLVGLPEEQLWVIDGNIYVKPLKAGPEDSGGGGWRIARKTARPKAQRAVWQPVYDSRFIRAADEDGGAWQPPWQAQRPERWQIAGRRSYRHEAADRGELRFDFVRALDTPAAAYAYNQQHGRNDEPIEDVMVAATFKPDRAGLIVELRTTARLDEAEAPARVLIGRIESDGRATLNATDAETGQTRLLAEAQAAAWEPQRGGRVELWYVDQEASLWVNGDRIAVWAFEMDIESLIEREDQDFEPAVSIAVSGTPVTLHHVVVARDLYYSSMQTIGASRSQGTLVKRISQLEEYDRLMVNDGRLVSAQDGWQVYLNGAQRMIALGLGPQRPGRASQLVALPDEQPITLLGGQLVPSTRGRPVTLHNGRLAVLNSKYSTLENDGRLYDSLITTRSGRPVRLDTNEFFCMGDNSPRSSDSRYWTDINPWIEQRMFSDGSDAPNFGVVPRELMMGRAFFVYFPAMRPWGPTKAAWVPNFGDMRFIH